MLTTEEKNAIRSVMAERYLHPRLDALLKKYEQEDIVTGAGEIAESPTGKLTTQPESEGGLALAEPTIRESTKKAAPSTVVPFKINEEAFEVPNLLLREVPGKDKAPEFVKGFEPGYDVWAGTKALGIGTAMLPEQVRARFMSMARAGDVSAIAQSENDRFIKQQAEKLKEFRLRYGSKKKLLPGITVEEATKFGSNLGYSVTNALCGLAAGLPLALAGSALAVTPVPGARVGSVALGKAAWVLGLLASGQAAYKMSKDEITQTLLDTLNEQRKIEGNAPMSESEWRAVKTEYEKQIKKYGLWEAIPEALSNVAGLKIIRLPVAKLLNLPSFKSRVVDTVIRGGLKFGALQSEELATEMVTQYGQAGVEHEIGVRPEAPKRGLAGMGEAAREVAPQTFLLTTAMGGAGAVGSRMYDVVTGKTDAGVAELTKEQVGEIEEIVSGKEGGVEEKPARVAEAKPEITISEKDVKKAGGEILPPTETEEIAAVAPATETTEVIEDIPISRTKVSEINLDPKTYQFRADVNDKGIARSLEGEYKPMAAGIFLLHRRADGNLYAVNCHHRLDLAKRRGIKEVPAHILDEAEGWTVEKAVAYGSRMNILQGGGTIYDWTKFIRRDKHYDPEQYQFAKGTKQEKAHTIAKRSSDNTYFSFIDRKITSGLAYEIAKTAPNDDALQDVGLHYAQTHPKANPELIANVMRAAMGGPKATQETLFGVESSYMQTIDKLAKAAAKRQREIAEQINAVRGVIKSEERAEIAKRLGVTVEDLKATQENKKRLEQERERWEHWQTNTELVNEVYEIAGLERNALEAAAPVVEKPAVEKPAPTEPSLFEPEKKAPAEEVKPAPAGEEGEPVEGAPLPPAEKPPKPTGELKAKEPWQMTKAEYEEMWRPILEVEPGVKVKPLGPTHKDIVERAIEQGKSVPAEVLKDYPDLQPKPTEKVPAKKPPKPVKIPVATKPPTQVALMRYNAIKKRRINSGYPDEIVFLRSGSKYRIMGPAAETAARVFETEAEIAEIGGRDVSYLDIPAKTHEEFVGDLAKSGYGVAVVEGVRGKPKVKTPKARDLSFKPQNLKNPHKNWEEFKDETRKTVKRSDIANYISDKLGVPIRHGKYRGKAAGIYKQKEEVIRKKYGDIRTISHEVGHYLEQKIPDISHLKINADEIGALLKDYEVTEATNRPVEAFGEFLRFWITEPGKATKRAPKFKKHFEKKIKEYPEIREVLSVAKRDYRRWDKMSPVAKVQSQIETKNRQAGLGSRIYSKFYELYKTVLDDLYPVKQFEDLAQKHGIEIPEEESAYIRARLLKGFIGKANVFLEKGTFLPKFYKMEGGRAVPVFTGKSLKAILRPVARRGELEDLSTYLVSRRVPELTERGINTGIEESDARESVKILEEKYPHFPGVAGELYDFQDAVLKYGQKSGLFSDEMYEAMKELNQNYVPFNRVMDELEVKGYMGRGFANVSKVVKRIKGSERDIINPLESIVKNTYAILNAADRNQVGVMMANLATKHPELGKLFEPIPTPMAKVATVNAKELGKKFADDMGLKSEEMADRIINIFRPSMFVPQDNVITILHDGKKHFYQVDPDIYKALMATEKQEMKLIVKFLGAPTRWLRAGAILTPEFMMRNPARDIMTAFVYSKYGFVPVIDTIRGIFSMVNKDSDYWLWRMGGGEHSMMVSMDRKYLQKSFNEIVEGKKFTDYIKHPIEGLRVFAEISEKLNRIPEANRALELGESPYAAAYASREITLDFSKGGSVGRTLNQMIAFWKAWALGWEKLVREFKNHPTRTSSKVFMGITLPSIVLYMVNRDDPRWRELPQWQKDLFWIIMTEDRIYRIPKPFEPGILFGSVPERILESIDKKDPDAVKRVAWTFLWGQAPGILPTVARPFIENWANKSLFLDRPIIPEYKTGMPPEAQYTGYTSETAKKLGELTHQPPAQIDNIIRGYFGGLGRHATDQIDGVLKGTGISSSIPEPSPTLADRPVMRAFVVRRPIGSSSESVNRFYERMQKLTADERLLKQYLQDNEIEKYYKYKDKHPELGFTYDWKTNKHYSITAIHFRQEARKMAEIRKTERQIYNSKTLSPKEKRKRVDEIDAILTKWASGALDYEKKLKAAREN